MGGRSNSAGSRPAPTVASGTVSAALRSGAWDIPEAAAADPTAPSSPVARRAVQPPRPAGHGAGTLRALERLRGRYLLAATLTALVVLVLLPWGFLIRASLVAESPSRAVSGFTLRYFAQALLAPGRAQLFGVTFLFSVGTAIVATVLGTLLAWLVERSDAPGARAAYALSYIFFAVPGLLKATGWILLFNSRNGFIWVLLRRLLHFGWTFPLYSLGGMIWSQALLWLPVVFLFLGTSFRNMDDSLEDAARTSGASRWRTFAAITLRLARPALWAVLLLSFIESLTTLETPLFIGMPGGVYTVTSEIYRTVTASLVPDYGTASALAVVLMAAVAVAIYGYQRALSSGASYRTVSGKGFRARRLPLGRYRWLGGLAVYAMLAMVALPLLALAWVSVMGRVLQPADLAAASRSLTLANYAVVIHSPDVARSVTDSLVIGIASGTGVVCLALAVAWLVDRVRSRGARLADQLAALPLVFPGILIGLGVLLTYLHLPVPIYGTVWLLVAAYVPLFLPYGVRFAHAGLVSVSPELEEGARVSGVSAARAAFLVTIPLMRPALVAAWVFTFLISVRELAAALLLYGPSNPVIAGILFDQWSEGSVGSVAAFGVLVAAGSGLVAVIVQRLAGGIGVWRSES